MLYFAIGIFFVIALLVVGPTFGGVALTKANKIIKAANNITYFDSVE